MLLGRLRPLRWLRLTWLLRHGLRRLRQGLGRLRVPGHRLRRHGLALPRLPLALPVPRLALAVLALAVLVLTLLVLAVLTLAVLVLALLVVPVVVLPVLALAHRLGRLRVPHRLRRLGLARHRLGRLVPGLLLAPTLPRPTMWNPRLRRQRLPVSLPTTRVGMLTLSVLWPVARLHGLNSFRRQDHG